MLYMETFSIANYSGSQNINEKNQFFSKNQKATFYVFLEAQTHDVEYFKLMTINLLFVCDYLQLFQTMVTIGTNSQLQYEQNPEQHDLKRNKRNSRFIRKENKTSPTLGDRYTKV